MMSTVCSQEVTPCFMSASVVITCQPDAASGIQRNRNHRREIRTVWKVVHNLIAIVLSLATSWLAVLAHWFASIWTSKAAYGWQQSVTDANMKQAFTSCQETNDMYYFYATIQVLEQQWKNAQTSVLTTCRSDVYHLLNMCHVHTKVRIKFWTSQYLLPCCHKLPHTNNQTSPHTINILNTRSITGHCDSPWEVRNSVLWHCSHVFSWEMNIVTAKQDVSALQTFNMSKNPELINWNNFL